MPLSLPCTIPTLSSSFFFLALSSLTASVISTLGLFSSFNLLKRSPYGTKKMMTILTATGRLRTCSFTDFLKAARASSVMFAILFKIFWRFTSKRYAASFKNRCIKCKMQSPRVPIVSRSSDRYLASIFIL